MTAKKCLDTCLSIFCELTSMKLKSYLLIITFLLTFTLSCGFLNSASTPKTARRVNPLANSEQSGAVVTATAITTTSVAAPIPTSLSNGLDTLTSYQLVLTMYNSVGGLDIILAHNASAQHLVITTTGINIDKLGNTGSVDMYQLNGNYYLQYSNNGSWLALPANQPPTIFVPTFSLVEGQVGALPTASPGSGVAETVNGVPAHRYDFTGQIVQGANSNGSMWVAATGGYVVKLTTASADGTASLSYDLNQINGQISINLPEAANQATFLGAPSGVAPAPVQATPPLTNSLPATNSNKLPVMADAEQLSSTETSVEYFSSSDLTTISNFYTDQLEAQGYVADDKLMVFDETHFEVGYDQQTQYVTVKATKQGDKILVQVTLRAK